MTEKLIIGAVIALAVLIVFLKLLRTFRGKRPDCCSGGEKIPLFRRAFKK